MCITFPGKSEILSGFEIQYTVNKGLAISRPQPGCHLPNSPWPGIIYPIPVPRRLGKKKSRNLIFIYSLHV